MPLTTDVLIADSTPLAATLLVLSDTCFVFVMVGSRVRGIITQADLNKPPVRLYLYGVLLLIEMHLTFWIRVEHPREEWHAYLSASRVGAAQRTLRRKMARGVETELLDCLTLGDKKASLSGSMRVRDRLGISDEELSEFDWAQGIRNQLAHGYTNLAEERSWSDISSTVSFIERVTQRSDEAIEHEAALSAAGYHDVLWESA
jgi:hypothetical protein